MKFLESIADMVGPAIVPRDVEHNGVTRKFHFRKITGEDADAILMSMMDENNKFDRAKIKGNVGRQIAASLCDEQGNLIATDAEINSLPVELRNKFEAIVTELNGGAEKKGLPDVSGSGTSSPQSSDTPSDT
jgi:hypothetical protein